MKIAKRGRQQHDPTRRHSRGTPLPQGSPSNDLWWADFKGKFNEERPHRLST